MTDNTITQEIVDNPRFLDVVRKMKADGFSERKIAETHGLSVSELRIKIAEIKRSKK